MSVLPGRRNTPFDSPRMLPSGRYGIIQPNVLHVGIDFLPPDQEVWSSMIRSGLGVSTQYCCGSCKVISTSFYIPAFAGTFLSSTPESPPPYKGYSTPEGLLGYGRASWIRCRILQRCQVRGLREEKPGTSARDAAAVQGETEAEPPSAAKDSNGHALSTTPQRSASTARAASTFAAVTTTASFVTTLATQASLPSRAAVRAFTANESKDQPDYVVPTRYLSKSTRTSTNCYIICPHWYLDVGMVIAYSSFIMTRLICTGTLTRSRSLMSPCCKAVKDDSRKHTVNFFLLLLPGGCRTNSEQGGNRPFLKS